MGRQVKYEGLVLGYFVVPASYQLSIVGVLLQSVCIRVEQCVAKRL